MSYNLYTKADQLVLSIMPGIYKGPNPPGTPLVAPALFANVKEYEKASDDVSIENKPVCLSGSEIAKTKGDASVGSFGGAVPNNQYGQKTEFPNGECTSVMVKGKPTVAPAVGSIAPMNSNATLGMLPVPTQTKVSTNKPKGS